MPLTFPLYQKQKSILTLTAYVLAVFSISGFSVAWFSDPEPLYVLNGVLAPVAALLSLPVYSWWKK